MRCDEALNRLNARADGELPPSDAAELEAHLAECSQCRSAAEGLRAVHAELRRAFVPRREAASRLAENTAAAVRALATTQGPFPVPAAQVRSFGWGQTLLAMAAGFLLAIVIFRPWQSAATAPAAVTLQPPVAHLAVASGPVEVQTASQIPVLVCPPSAPLRRNSIVRTGPTERREISLDDGSAVRLDCNTEIKLHESEVVEVDHGRLWFSCADGPKGLEIQSSGGTIIGNQAAQLALTCQPNSTRLIVVDGTARVRTGQDSKEIGTGQQVRIIQGKLEKDPEWRDALLETAWVNSLLALRSSEHPELVKRVDRLLANIGAAKLSLLYEDELRRLGDSGVPPLLAYLASTRETPNVDQRATAARIIADVAEANRIADLITFLTDANADVRFHAARGLERLTGRDQGIKPQAWQSQPWASCEPAHQKWINWWAANRDRYPNSQRELVAPQAPPF